MKLISTCQFLIHILWIPWTAHKFTSRNKKLSVYRVFHLKRNPKYYTWIHSRTNGRNQWRYWIPAAVSRCCSWCIAWNRYCRNFSYFVTRWALCHRQTLPVSRNGVTTRLYCCHMQYFLVRIRTAKCFTNSIKRFWCEVMFENEHTFCSWIHNIRIYTTFEQLAQGWESLLRRGGPASDLIFMPYYVIVIR
jgi:hypothetical protein